MFGINGYEFILLGILAVIIVGPERLPVYAEQLGQLVRKLRAMGNGAREQLREEMGPEIDDVDWRKLDPRQYDPRRIIREALTEDLADDWNDAIKPVDAKAPQPTPVPPTPTPSPVSHTPLEPRTPAPTTPTLAPVTGGPPGTSAPVISTAPPAVSSTHEPSDITVCSGSSAMPLGASE